MKKLIKALLAVCIVISLSLTLIGCYTVGVGEITLVIADGEGTEYSVRLDKFEQKEGLISALEYLEEKGVLEYTANSGPYGSYLTQVGALEENGSQGRYIGIWTSVEADFDVSAYATTVEHNGIKLTSSGVGASQMTLTDGAVIYIGYLSW